MTASRIALDLTFQSHYGYLVRWCRRVAPMTSVDPEDIVHAAYLRVQGRFRTVKVSSQQPLAFLKQAIRWEAADRQRREWRHREREFYYSDCRRALSHLAPAVVLEVNESLELLPARLRMICLALLEGKMHRQICVELQLSAGALAVALCRARQMLVRLLDLAAARRSDDFAMHRKRSGPIRSAA